MSPSSISPFQILKERQFIEQRQQDWSDWDRWLAGEAQAIPAGALPRQFRHLSQDLSLARDRRYSLHLIKTLHDRVLAVHQRLYGARRQTLGWLDFLLGGLARRVRDEKRVVLAAAALFFLPFLFMLAILQFHPEGIYLLVPAESVGDYEYMYRPDATAPGRPREAGDSVAMLGFYIANNVKINFQCFAGGILFGIGSLFYIIFNGLHLGAIAGHLTQLGYIETFWGFVAGHSALELTGIVLSGAAGLKLGMALVAPGRLSRVAALKKSSGSAVELLYGAALLTFLAAFVEAFWSPLRSFPVEIKYVVGVIFWICLLAYLLFAGRSTPSPQPLPREGGGALTLLSPGGRGAGGEGAVLLRESSFND
jgi:uncharacterized membrane protein SpoIIM required for sporulation